MKQLTCLLLSMIFVFISCKEKKEMVLPPPIDTIVKMDMEDGTKPDRKAWMEKMHQTAPGVSWENIDAANRAELRKYKSNRIEDVGSREPGELETIVENHLSGVWFERGSKNQAGSIHATEYDPINDVVYTISDGFNLWKGARNGSSWQAINEDLRIDQEMLFRMPSGRLIVSTQGRPVYSDDEGASFVPSAGIQENNGGNSIKDPIKLTKADGSIELFFIARRGNPGPIEIYHSDDYGSSFESVISFVASIRQIAICNPHGTDDVYLMEQISNAQSNIWKWDPNLNSFQLVNSNSPMSFGGRRGDLDGAKLDDSTLRLFTTNGDEEFHYTDDFGQTWNFLSVLPHNPWRVGVYVSPSNPDVMLTGAVNAYRSTDGGESWHLVNEWWEYYDNVASKLHADIMFFNEFKTIDGEPFLLISNHGGLSISYDGGDNNQNISLEGLNVNQFYSVATSPNDVTYVFAGSQDQGFQRGRLVGHPIVADFDQVISGDYGHIIFTQNHTKLWTVYPGGWMTYYDSPFNEWQGYTASYDINSPNESVWIPPMIPHPDQEQNAAYIAGGNVDSLPGRHIIEMRYVSGSIQAEALPFDFSVSGGNISAMEVNPFDHNVWYVATDNGKVYKSTNGGNGFVQTALNMPGGNYLYGSDLLASKIDENKVYLSGSGYSGPGVVKSTDKGQSWQEMSNGLPNTMVFAIAANEDESLLFAATEVGPFVYVEAEDMWYPLSGSSAPFTRFWSVEYIPLLKMARFGTYGRGVWDFEVVGTSSNSTGQFDNIDVSLFPNPVQNVLQISSDKLLGSQIEVFSVDGKSMLKSVAESNNHSFDVSNLVEGTYVLRIQNEGFNKSELFIKSN